MMIENMYMYYKQTSKLMLQFECIFTSKYTGLDCPYQYFVNFSILFKKNSLQCGQLYVKRKSNLYVQYWSLELYKLCLYSVNVSDILGGILPFYMLSLSRQNHVDVLVLCFVKVLNCNTDGMCLIYICKVMLVNNAHNRLSIVDL